MNRTGTVIFFTGLSGSGKTTLAEALAEKIKKERGIPITILDGDNVRTFLSSELGFSKEHRDLNIRRIGFVAAEIAKHGGFVICCPIAPYESVRQEVRKIVENNGGKFILIYVSTPISECEKRDTKGLYRKARDGIIKNFTGISDPYEIPCKADVILDTTNATVNHCVHYILEQLEKK